MIEELSGDFLQQLRGFYYVAHLGSMGQAAKIMHRSQSSVSRLIKQLEESLGVSLFSRVQKGVVLTNEGGELLNETVVIFERIRSIHFELGQKNKEPSGEVSFEVNNAAFIKFVTPLLHELHILYPKIRLNILETQSLENTQKSLEERNIDFAIIVIGNLSSGFKFHKVFSDSPVLIAPRGMEKELKTPIKFEDLPDFPIIKLPAGTGFNRFIEQDFPSGWLNKRTTITASSMFYQFHMVAAGLGLAIISDTCLSAEHNLPIAAFSLEHIMPKHEHGLVQLSNSYMTPQAKAVLEFFKSKADLQ